MTRRLKHSQHTRSEVKAVLLLSLLIIPICFRQARFRLTDSVTEARALTVMSSSPIPASSPYDNGPPTSPDHREIVHKPAEEGDHPRNGPFHADAGVAGSQPPAQEDEEEGDEERMDIKLIQGFAE